MKVVVLRNFRSLGQPGTIINVKMGYAKNFLIPAGIVVIATKANIKDVEARKEILAQSGELSSAQAVAAKEYLEGRELIFVRQTSDDGRLYGSVNTKDICDVINEKLGAEEIDASITRSDVNFSVGIKAVGVYEIKIFIDGPVFATVLVNVCRSEKEAAANILAHGNKDSGAAAKVSDDVEATKLSHLSGKMKDRRRKVGHSAEVEAEAEAKAKAKAEKKEEGVVSFTEDEESPVEDVIEDIADDSEEAKAVESLEAVEKAVEESVAEMESEEEVKAEAKEDAKEEAKA